jgi:hypothetical protein
MCQDDCGLPWLLRIQSRREYSDIRATSQYSLTTLLRTPSPSPPHCRRRRPPRCDQSNMTEGEGSLTSGLPSNADVIHHTRHSTNSSYLSYSYSVLSTRMDWDPLVGTRCLCAGSRTGQANKGSPPRHHKLLVTPGLWSAPDLVLMYHSMHITSTDGPRLSPIYEVATLAECDGAMEQGTHGRLFMVGMRIWRQGVGPGPWAPQ